MIKNLLLLAVFSWVSFSYAEKPHIAQESISEAESFKYEKASEEQEARRSVAGSKIKKKKDQPSRDIPEASGPSSATDSEVRYWQYSE